MTTDQRVREAFEKLKKAFPETYVTLEFNIVYHPASGEQTGWTAYSKTAGWSSVYNDPMLSVEAVIINKGKPLISRKQ